MRSIWLLVPCLLSTVAQAQDADADGVLDATELAYGDSDGDGVPNAMDSDDDGDTRPTRVEEDGSLRDQDRDGTPDYLDADEDDDGLVLLAEDVDGDGVLSALDDSDGDGLIDPLDADDDGDGLETRFELGQLARPLDSDGDGRADYRDPDDDGDGWPTRDERALDPHADANANGLVAYLDPSERGPVALADDLDGDGVADAQDPDLDGDSIANTAERDGDSDGDGLPDVRDPDDDGDGVESAREGMRDSDGDQVPDYLDADDDGDGIPTREEQPDQNEDGVADDPRITAFVPDYLTADDDNDGVTTERERPDARDRDTDADGVPDHRDGDDDGDGLETNVEAPDGEDRDLDSDGAVDRLDTDDDGDSLATRLECIGVPKQDVDADGLWNCYDLDSDGDAASDAMEGLLDGLPEYLAGLTEPQADAPVEDAGSSVVDAGVPLDAAIPDAGAPRDGSGGTISTRPRAEGGCTLTGTRSGSALAMLGVLALAALVRRRGWLCSLLLFGCESEPDRVTLGLDASLDGASTIPVRDAQPDGASACMPPALRFLVGDTSARSFHASAEGSRVRLAFVAPSCGGATSLGQGKGVHYVSFASGGAASVPLELDEDACLPVREPTLLAQSLYFGSARDGQYDLYTVALEAPRTPSKVTTGAELELGLSAAALRGGPALAYVRQQAWPSTEVASVQLWIGGASRELLPVTSGHHPVDLTLVARAEPTRAGHGLLGWRSDAAGSVGLYLRELDGLGQPAGEVTSVARDGDALSFAIGEHLSGLVYTQRGELRYRTLVDGVLGEPRVLTTGEQDVSQPAAAPYRNGFAVAYRNREPGGAHTVRLLSLDEQGNVASTTTLAESSGEGTHLQLVATQDGRLTALWDEPAPPPDAGTLPDFNRVLQVVRLSCF